MDKTTDPTAVAKAVFKYIKAHCKNNPTDIAKFRIDVWTRDRGEVLDHIDVGSDGKFGKFATYSELNAFGKELEKMVATCKGMKILGRDKRTERHGPWYSEYTTTLCDVPNRFRVFGKASKEWEQLSRLVKKYTNMDIDPMTIHYRRMFGKRGRLDTETERRYIAWDCPKWCEDMVAWIRANKASRDTLKVEVFRGERCDDQEYSEYYETECHGAYIDSYKFTVTTPSGKVKGTHILSEYGSW